jgi:hypothetical protein
MGSSLEWDLLGLRLGIALAAAGERTESLELAAEVVVDGDGGRERLDDPAHLPHDFAQLRGENADSVDGPVDRSNGLVETIEHRRELDEQRLELDQDTVELAKRPVDVGDRLVDVQGGCDEPMGLAWRQGGSRGISAIP